MTKNKLCRHCEDYFACNSSYDKEACKGFERAVGSDDDLVPDVGNEVEKKVPLGSENSL